MHELPVVENILSIATQNAQQNKAKEVISINLVIGQLSSLIDDSIQFYWNVLSEGTICENAKLNIRRIPAIIKCKDCGKEYDIKEEFTPCPHCGGINVRITQGEEFYLESIDIET